MLFSLINEEKVIKNQKKAKKLCQAKMKMSQKKVKH